jgi:hypothetical protein
MLGNPPIGVSYLVGDVAFLETWAGRYRDGRVAAVTKTLEVEAGDMSFGLLEIRR